MRVLEYVRRIVGRGEIDESGYMRRGVRQVVEGEDIMFRKLPEI